MKRPQSELNFQKDYLTIEEAAAYCGVSVSHFTRERTEYRLGALLFMGKKLFRKTDIQAAIENKSF
jgi:CRP-like cAMP-binding protein